MAEFSKSLVRSSFSSFLVDEIFEEAAGKIDAQTEATLRSEVETKSDLSGLRKALKSVKKLISEGLYDSLDEELSEIADDFTWKKSDRARYVAEVHDWVNSFHAKIRSEPRFDELYAGGHAELEVIYVCGSAKSQKDLEDFISFLEKKKPPRKILTNVSIKD